MISDIKKSKADINVTRLLFPPPLQICNIETNVRFPRSLKQISMELKALHAVDSPGINRKCCLKLGVIFKL